jgi:hypothetical protein
MKLNRDNDPTRFPDSQSVSTPVCDFSRGWRLRMVLVLVIGALTAGLFISQLPWPGFLKPGRTRLFERYRTPGYDTL